MTYQQPSRRAVLKWGLAGAGALALAACGKGSQPAASASGSASTTPMPDVPSPRSTARVTSAEQAAALVEWQARQAADAGSYGIAGALIRTDTGEVLMHLPNRVVQQVAPAAQATAGKTFTYDPTAHGERQLVYWYFANREKLKLPEPAQLTVVTSLDPCAMCTGTILTAGMNAGVVAMDTFSGINYTGKGTFDDLPDGPRQKALATFGYYAVRDGRAFQGSQSVAFAKDQLEPATFAGCETIYQDSADAVRTSRKQTGIEPSALTDPAVDPAAAAVVAAFQKAYPGAFTLKLADFQKPDAALKSLLGSLRSATPGATNAVAFVDPFGNLVSAAANDPATSPVATAMMAVLQGYSITRFDLVNNPATSAIAQKTITSPKYGTFVWLEAPDPAATTTIEDLGAYGSAVEGKLPGQTAATNFQFYDPPANGTVDQLRQVIAGLPPLYSQLIAINPQQVQQ